MFRAEGREVYNSYAKVATAFDEIEAIRIVRALNTMEILGHAFPGLLDGATPVNGNDLVGMLTKILAKSN